MIYAFNAKPPFVTATLIGFQHFLAVFAGILTAPLIIALGMGLSIAETNYLISSSLVVSGFATLIQISRVGPIGSGLLSIQGTSFAFIGPLIFSYHSLSSDMSADAALGIIFGSSAFCAFIVMCLSFTLKNLSRIITSNVTGATIILLGLSLVVTTGQNIVREIRSADNSWEIAALTTIVFTAIVLFSRSTNQWLRISCITLGLSIGMALAFFLGLVDFSLLSSLDKIFVPEPLHYKLAIDLTTVLLLFPIFLISVTESIGDLTATSALSDLPIKGDRYWQRIQGGIFGDALNSLIAAVMCTFPNTTFSQNNGVIRITGICSRYIGFYVAAFLIILGMFPIVGGIFQAIPNAVIYGATLLMFSLVGYAGYSIVKASSPGRRDWTIVILAILLGYATALSASKVPSIPAELLTILSFPVSTGAIFAILLELFLPHTID